MTVHQISIFVENKSGTLLRVLDLFKEAGVQLIASTISDTVEYGIYRIICSGTHAGMRSVAGGRHFGQHVGSVCHHVGQPSRACGRCRTCDYRG